MDLRVIAGFVAIFSVAVQCAAEDDVYVSNVDNSNCLKCMCMAASACNLKAGCYGRFCGPFHMTLEYYLDAIDNTSMQKSEEAYKECAQDYKCAERVVKYYLAKYAKDCNKDGVTDCTDYAMIHFNGGHSCENSLFRTAESTTYAGRFLNCTGY